MKQNQKQQQIKKDKQQIQKPVLKKVEYIGISKSGKKLIIAGICILVLGFFILSKTDPEGQNWASIVSPFFIIGAYVIIGFGIIIPEKKNPGILPVSVEPK